MSTNPDQQSYSQDSDNYTDPLLDATIKSKDKSSRAALFETAWNTRWNSPKGKQGYFQTTESESPFSEYSSKGWKIHIAFKKGEEKAVAQFLYINGLYFKVESQIGTYFNGLIASGATIYIGSHDNMMSIAKEIEANLNQLLVDGVVATFGNTGKTVAMGSGSDIEVKPKITARFDVAKTQYGWESGNGKYAEHGIPSWTGLSGIPVLKSKEREVQRIINRWDTYTPNQRKIYLERILVPAYEESKNELVKDFGEEYLFGKQN